VDSVRAVAFSPDGQTVASGGVDGKVVVWNVEKGPPIQVVAAHGDEVTGLAFSRPDGRLLASASYDGTVRLWDVSTGEL
jgi:WD40 repeat protein